MFWTVKTIALVGFPFDDVNVAPINDDLYNVANHSCNHCCVRHLSLSESKEVIWFLTVRYSGSDRPTSFPPIIPKFSFKK